MELVSLLMVKNSVSSSLIADLVMLWWVQLEVCNVSKNALALVGMKALTTF